MKVILNQDIKKLGKKGDVVEVAKGYARNYLLPKNLGIKATPKNILLAEKMQEKRQACLLYTSPSPRDDVISRMPSSA